MGEGRQRRYRRKNPDHRALPPPVPMTASPDAVAEPTIDADLPPESPLVRRLAVTVVVTILVLMFAGAEVTSTNSGMAFTTWPDAYGHYLWPNDPTLGGVLEHSHRLLGALAGLAAIALLVAVWLLDRRRYMKWLSLGLLGLITAQGLLGGFRVWFDEHFPVLFPIIHGTFAHLVLAFSGLVASVASLAWMARSIAPAGKVRASRRFAVFSLLVLILQIVLGVVLRHSEDPVAKWSHIGFALVAAIAVLVASSYSLGRFGSIPGFTRLNRIILALLGCQLLLGFIALMLRRPKVENDTSRMIEATVVSAHVVVGAGLLLAVTLLVARSYRTLRPRA